MRSVFEKKDKGSMYFWPIFLGFIIHFFYEFLFFYFDFPEVLRYYNIISILIFGVGSFLLRKNENPIMLFICFFEVTIFAIVSVHFTDWKYEFQNWIFAMSFLSITVPFKNRRLFHSLPLINIAVYTFLYLESIKFNASSIDIIVLTFCFTNVFGSFFIIIFSERVLQWSKIMEQFFLKKEYEKMKEKAGTDELTNLVNRYKMNEILEYTNTYFTEKDSEFYICFADIDDFKKINDTYGHDAGDEVLMYISNIFKQEIQGKNTVARWGGEEFLILLSPPATREEVLEKLNDVRYKISKSEIKYEKNIIKLTMTFGVVSSKGFKNVYDMTKRADELMYIGKTTGKNKVVI